MIRFGKTACLRIAQSPWAAVTRKVRSATGACGGSSRGSPLKYFGACADGKSMNTKRLLELATYLEARPNRPWGFATDCLYRVFPGCWIKDEEDGGSQYVFTDPKEPDYFADLARAFELDGPETAEYLFQPDSQTEPSCPLHDSATAGDVAALIRAFVDRPVLVRALPRNGTPWAA